MLAELARFGAAPLRREWAAEIAAHALRLGLDPLESVASPPAPMLAGETIETTPLTRRITPEMVDAQIADEVFHTFPDTCMTVCALKLINGFVEIGESACTDPAAFDAELGRVLAKGRARQKVFEFLTFRQRDEIERENPFVFRLLREAAEWPGTRIG